MYYFENDPLQQVYEDLYKDKTPTHFDKVMELKGTLCHAFCEAMNKINLPKSAQPVKSYYQSGDTTSYKF